LLDSLLQEMSGGRPTLSLTRRTPLKSRKNINSNKKKNGNIVVNNSNTKAWVDTVTDLSQYKPTPEELEQRKLARKSNNKLLAKVALSDKRLAQLQPDKQKLIEKQILLEQRKNPNQNVEAILARSEQVMEICQGILNGEMITPTYSDLGLGAEVENSPFSPSPAPVQVEPVRPEAEKEKTKEKEDQSPASPPHHVTPYMNSAALNEIAGELLITVRELREELLQEREARERLEREVMQQRELLSELAREVVRLQIFCSGTEPGPPVAADSHTDSHRLSSQLEQTKIV